MYETKENFQVNNVGLIKCSFNQRREKEKQALRSLSRGVDESNLAFTPFEDSSKAEAKKAVSDETVVALILKENIRSHQFSGYQFIEMANCKTNLIFYVSALCVLATMFGTRPVNGAPAAAGNGELDPEEREAAILYYAMKMAGTTGGDAGLRNVLREMATYSDPNRKKKRNNAELINGLLGMNLSQLDLAGKK